MVENHWHGKRVVIIGAARQGLALARFLARHKAVVVLNDQRPEQLLQAEMKSLADYDVQWAVGGHSLDILSPLPDVVCVSGGVPLENPLVVHALNHQIQVTNDTQIFMDAVPCKTAGITGSAGKTTTTTLVGRMAKTAEGKQYRRVWIGGNIGDPLLNYVDEMQPDDLAILEISSFQSEIMTSSPNVAAILNITPNHLDRHKTMENYSAAKARVIQFQKKDDWAVLGRDDPEAWRLSKQVRGGLISFGLSPLPTGQYGTFTEDGLIYLRGVSETTRLRLEDEILLRGEHNRLNVMAACTIAHAVGLDMEAMRAGISNFGGVPHRIEYVRTWHGTEWYNDSIATAPERTIAAIRAFQTPLILLLGGKDKDLPWDELAKLVHQRVSHVIIFGAAAEKIEHALSMTQPESHLGSITRVKTCQEAVKAAGRLAQPGFTALFSPGGTSYDEFKDFEERGERFKQWVLEFSEKAQ